MTESPTDRHRVWFGFFVLYVVNILNGFSYNLAFYVINEYATLAMQKLYFPNMTFNSSSHVDEDCSGNNATNQTNVDSVVQEKVSQWSIYMSLSGGILSLVSTTTFGTLSDRYGRRIMLALSLVGAFLKMVLCSFAIRYSFDIYYFVFVFVLEGCTGGWITVLSISFAYVADLTPAGNQRSVAIAASELILNLGFYVGTISSGYLIKLLGGYFYPSVISALSALVAILCSLFLPETITKEENKKHHPRLKDHIKELFHLFVHKSEEDPNLRWKYLLSISALFAIWMGRLGVGNVELYYILSKPICFSAVVISIYVTTKGVIQQVMTLVYIKVCQYCIRDETTAILSCLFASGYYVMLGIARNTGSIYIAAAVGTLSFACIPVMRSTISKFTPRDKQGSVFGAVSFFENICSMVGTVTAGAIYSATVSFYKGFVFFVMALLMGLAIVLLLLLIRVNVDHSQQKKIIEYEKIQEN